MADRWRDEHPLSRYGYRRPPGWLWPRSRRLYVAYARATDVWLILRGKLSLHEAWQAGHFDGAAAEYQRCVVNGGR